MIGYPEGWAECDCGRPVLDGHLTCGDVRCGTQAEAEARRLGRPAGRPPLESVARLFRGECIFCGSGEHVTSRCPELG